MTFGKLNFRFLHYFPAHPNIFLSWVLSFP